MRDMKGDIVLLQVWHTPPSSINFSKAKQHTHSRIIIHCHDATHSIQAFRRGQPHDNHEIPSLSR